MSWKAHWLSTILCWQFLVSDISIATAASDATDSDVDFDARMASDDHLDVGL